MNGKLRKIQLEPAFTAESKGEAPRYVGEGTVGEKNRHNENHIPEIVRGSPLNVFPENIYYKTRYFTIVLISTPR